MDMSGEYRVAASRQVVWSALNDPDVLKASIAGCEELEADQDGGFTAKVRAKVGPVSARFSGRVNIVNSDPPNGYRIEGEGTGGAAGFAKGGADVQLIADGEETILTYQANASVGGKLAQIGSRLIDGTARKMADDFFSKFSAIVAEKAAENEGADLYDHSRHLNEPIQLEPEKDDGTVIDTNKESNIKSAEKLAIASRGMPQWIWIPIAGLVLVGGLIFLS